MNLSITMSFLAGFLFSCIGSLIAVWSFIHFGMNPSLAFYISGFGGGIAFVCATSAMIIEL